MKTGMSRDSNNSCSRTTRTRRVNSGGPHAATMGSDTLDAVKRVGSCLQLERVSNTFGTIDATSIGSPEYRTAMQLFEVARRRITAGGEPGVPFWNDSVRGEIEVKSNC